MTTRTVLITPAQRRAAEALVSWYEATRQPVAGAVRRIASPEVLRATTIDLLPHLPDAATARAVRAYDEAVRDLLLAYDHALPTWSRSVAMTVLRLEIVRGLRRSAADRRRLRDPAAEDPPAPADDPVR